MKNIINSYCHYCLCRNCSGIKCKRYKKQGLKYRCLECHYKRRVMDCDFFTHKKIKHFKIKRKFNNGFTAKQMDKLIYLLELLLDEYKKKW